MKLKKLRTNELFRLTERVELSDIEQTQVGVDNAPNVRLMASIEIEIDDAKLIWPFGHQWEQSR